MLELLSRTAAILLFAILTQSIAFADAPVSSTAAAQVVPTTPTAEQTQSQLAKIRDLKLQLFNDLNSGDIAASSFDNKTELDIASTQMAIAEYYLSQGDRKNAAISAIIARKILQRIYNNPNDPRLIGVYSLLVQIYSSSVDIDSPGVNVSDAAKAMLYRQAIDHIHAQ